MRIDVFLTAAEVEPADVTGRTAVVIDVLRATSTIVQALASGATAIYPTTGTEEAIKLATSLGREDTVLCGERRGVMIEGYDLGNSPVEFTEQTVGGKRLIMNTTNGTRALLAAEEAGRVLVSSFLNLRAVAEAARDAEALAIVCAGRDDRFSLEDAVCAGLFLRRLEAWSAPEDVAADANDAARAVRALADDVSGDASFLGATDAGRQLVELGMAHDLEHCAALDRLSAVPELRDRVIRLSEG